MSLGGDEAVAAWVSWKTLSNTMAFGDEALLFCFSMMPLWAFSPVTVQEEQTARPTEMVAEPVSTWLWFVRRSQPASTVWGPGNKARVREPLDCGATGRMVLCIHAIVNCAFVVAWTEYEPWSMSSSFALVVPREG